MKRLNSPLVVECFLLEGKAESDTAISGRITHLGNNMAKGSLSADVADYTNLRILLTSGDFGGSAELYAKVIPQEDSDAGSQDRGIRLQFTSMAQEAKNYLERIRSDD